MKRHLSHICLLAATLVAAPSAFSDSVIIKCVDDAGRVTLTDRPCEAGATSVRVEAYPLVAEPSTLPPPRLVQASVQRSALPMERVAAKPLSSDVATLKAARAQFLLGDADSRETLAGR